MTRQGSGQSFRHFIPIGHRAETGSPVHPVVSSGERWVDAVSVRSHDSRHALRAHQDRPPRRLQRDLVNGHPVPVLWSRPDDTGVVPHQVVWPGETALDHCAALSLLTVQWARLRVRGQGFRCLHLDPAMTRPIARRCRVCGAERCQAQLKSEILHGWCGPPP